MADTRERDRVPPQVAAAEGSGDVFDRDLNPDPLAGQNLGASGAHPQKQSRTARDIKDLHARFRDWRDSDLDEIPVIEDGSRLEQAATYIDLRDEQPGEFTATGGMHAEPGHWYVAKSDVPFEIWNRLLGIQNMTRTKVRGG
jgi:hypothetical protein